MTRPRPSDARGKPGRVAGPPYPIAVRLGKLHLLLLAGVVCALLHLASLASRRVTPAFPDVPFTATGSFTPDGQYPGERFTPAVGVRMWGSWSGGDENTGTFELGPFPAPRILRFGAGGYPSGPDNTLHVEQVATGERQLVPCGWEAGGRWAHREQAVGLLAVVVARLVELPAVPLHPGGAVDGHPVGGPLHELVVVGARLGHLEDEGVEPEGAEAEGDHHQPA